ncbi:hypothetical protein IKE71_01685 [Candidatus Saccharibacteria bacterium]|nr:hypothetical protein [Candidatus Saccharibacteria bacterium]
MHPTKTPTLTDAETNIRLRTLYRKYLIGSTASFLLFLVFFALVPTLISEASATTNLSASVLWSGISLELDPDYAATQAGGSTSNVGHGDINFGTITPTSNSDSNKGTMRVAKKTIGINTSGKYYAVYISMANPTSGTAVNDLLLDGTTNIPIPSVGDGSTSGTWTSPSVFSGSAWGYAVPGSPVTNGFDNASAYSAYPISSSSGYITSDLTASNSNVYNTTKWAAIPVVNNTSLSQMIWKQETNNTKGFGTYTGSNEETITGDTENNHFDIYFATMVDTDTIAGEYSNQIVYTALASARSLDRISTNVKRDKSFGGEGDTVHLEFDLATSASDLSADNLTVAIVKHSVAKLIDGGLSNTSLTISNNDYAECTSISNVVFGENGASLDCELPETIDGILGKGDGKGEYDFWIKVNNYNYNYISRYKDGSNNLVASFTYVGLQSTTDTEGEDFVVREMQEMTGSICKNTNTWGKTIGANARIYSPTDTTGVNNTSTASGFDSTALVNSNSTLESGYTIASQSAKVGTGTFLLEDNRDQKTYLVRRLADGNCWMVQNLDLNLADFAGTHNLTSENTNITSDYWDPSAVMLAKNTVLETTGATAGLSVVNYQFQSESNFGNDLKWGSVCAEGTGPFGANTAVNAGMCTGANIISVAINANTSYARSYNNDSATATSTGSGKGPAYMDGTQNLLGPVATCISYTADERSGHSECRMNYKGMVSLPEGTYSGSNNLTHDSAWQPGLITDHGGGGDDDNDSFTMRGSMYFGDYYNWYAATAGVGQYKYDTDTTVSQDICPKGWKLPAGDSASNGSWLKLFRDAYSLTGSGYGSGASITGAIQLPISSAMFGYYYWNNGALISRGNNGMFWSSTGHDSSSVRIFDFSFSGFFSAQAGTAKINGLPIRCLARD